MTESNLRVGVRNQTPTENVSETIDIGETSRELTDGELRQLQRTLQGTPRQFGYPVATWRRQLVQRYIRESFDVTYSLQFIDRLVKAVGVAHRLERRDV
jgi:transposase